MITDCEIYQMIKSMTETKNRIYAVEFLRVFFIFFIILGHMMELYPDVKDSVLRFLHTRETHTWFGVEFFFIIGGFFLYKRLQSTRNITELIKKIYLRLFPALLFVFLMCTVFIDKHYLYRFPLIFSLTAGIGLPEQATGWGDWYVSTYFWCSLLYIGIFCHKSKYAFLWTGILIYLTACLKFHAPYEFMSTYYTVICTDFIRGIYSMGLGIIAAYLSEHFKVSDKLSLRLIFTIIELFFLWCVLKYIVSSSRFSFWETELIFSALLILMDHSAGYISYALNKYKKIQYISRYTYSIFVSHIVCVSVLWTHRDIGLSGSIYSLFCGGGVILIGIFEYHIIEKKLVPQVIKYFQKETE